MFSGMVPSPGFQSRFFVLENENRTQDAGHALLRQGRNPKVRKNSGVIEHRRRIRTNNMIERLNREIRRRTRVVGSFPDGNSALMLICARIRYVTANEWSTRRYLDMSRFDDNLVEAN